MAKSIQKMIDEVTKLADELAAPAKMTPREALEFFEELSSAFEARIEGLRSDIGED